MSHLTVSPVMWRQQVWAHYMTGLTATFCFWRYNSRPKVTQSFAVRGSICRVLADGKRGRKFEIWRNWYLTPIQCCQLIDSQKLQNYVKQKLAIETLSFLFSYIARDFQFHVSLFLYVLLLKMFWVRFLFWARKIFMNF